MRLNRNEIYRLPHDLVHAMLSDIPEGIRFGNLTPDIVYDNKIIEIATSLKTDHSELVKIMNSKYRKYEHLILDNDIELNIIVVNPHGAFDYLQSFTESDYESMRRAFLFGQKIKQEFRRRFDDLGSDAETTSYLSLLREVKDDAKRNNVPHLGMIPQLDFCLPSTNKFSFKDYEHLCEAKTYRNQSTCIHLPMVILEDDDSTPVKYFNSRLPNSHIINSAITLLLNSKRPKDFEDLSNIAQINKYTRKDSKNKFNVEQVEVGHSDQIKVKSTRMQKEFLALRGVNKKKNNTRNVRDKTLNSKLPICLTEEHKMLTMYLNHGSEKKGKKTSISFSKESQDVDLTPFPILDRLPEMICLENLDLIVRELAYNIKRNVPENTYIVRKVLNKPLVVIMKPTRFGGPEDYPIHFCVLFKGEVLSEYVLKILSV
jgi:hypothetical protein